MVANSASTLASVYVFSTLLRINAYPHVRIHCLQTYAARTMAKPEMVPTLEYGIMIIKSKDLRF